MSTIYDRIRARRLELGLTAEDLARTGDANAAAEKPLSLPIFLP